MGSETEKPNTTGDGDELAEVLSVSIQFITSALAY